MRRGLGGLILLGALAFALSGCAQPGPEATSTATTPPSAEPSATPTPTLTPTQTPSPTPTPAQTVVAFGGDCNQLVSPEVATAHGVTLRPNDATTTTLASWEPGLSDSYARIGAFNCVWVLGDDQPAFGVTVVPSEAITDDIRTEWSDALSGECIGNGGHCDYILEENGVAARSWSYVEAGDEVLDALRGALASISEVPVIGDLPSGSWTPPTCDSVRSIVSGVTQIPEFTHGAPTDNVDIGPLADAVKSAAPYGWCPMVEVTSGSDPMRVIVAVQPGIGEFTDSSVQAAGAQETSIVGADAAWNAESAPQTGPQSVTVSVVGNNRLIVVLRSSSVTDLTTLTATISADIIAEMDQ